ncbi:hypothetical protein TNCV_3522741 [Trichonephila clavipes]|uniref:Uncharacterized protein n=1 Tax=Trichonephila clavipes TaxID=2585209 RepID=A0A8X7BG85_TRICX|nr:hypothetical protein TNCV_3522741 [Trichonephila clavipes]
MQVTVRFCSVSPQFRGRTPWERSGASYPLPLPPTLREDLRLDGYLKYPHTAEARAMPSPGFEPRPYRTTVSFTNRIGGTYNMLTKYQTIKFIDFCEVWFLPESVARVAAIVRDHRCHTPRH